MTRRRYRWDIYCEKLFERDYVAFFNEMVNIRPYFSDSPSEPEDDNHSEVFNLHFNDRLIPERAKYHLIASHVIIIVYYFTIVVLFNVHTS